MARSRLHQPPVPAPAERARAIATRARTAAVIAGAVRPRGAGPGRRPDEVLRAVPTLHHVPASGAATLQVPTEHPFVALARERGTDALPVMLELADTAPVALRQPVRGLVWIYGRLRMLPVRVARRAVGRIAAEQPDERLLDVGHGDELLRLDPAGVVLSDPEGTEALAPTAMSAAAEDPLQRVADGWLAHLAAAHASMVGELSRRLPPALRRSGRRVAPLAVDRLGLRLRVETAHGDHDVRLPFARPVTCPRRLGEEVRRLAGRAGEEPDLRRAPDAAAGG